MEREFPSDAPADIDEAPPLRLAGRGERLGGFLIDTLILLAILLPLMYVGGYFEGMMSGHKPGTSAQIMWSLIGFALFTVVQGIPLANDGQTWGKKLLNMKIVDLAGAKPEFGRKLLLRYGVGQVISMVPWVGGIYFLVDSLFVFRGDKRCIHDLIAGTRVVVAR
jgi:uncharacterized RDD family membrane protein YckC